MRPLLVAGFVLAVIVAGTLGLVSFGQAPTAERRQAEQQQQTAVAFETSAAATSDTIGATMIARQRADAATQQATSIVGAAQSLATPPARRLRLR